MNINCKKFEEKKVMLRKKLNFMFYTSTVYVCKNCIISSRQQLFDLMFSSSLYINTVSQKSGYTGTVHNAKKDSYCDPTSQVVQCGSPLVDTEPAHFPLADTSQSFAGEQLTFLQRPNQI